MIKVVENFEIEDSRIAQLKLSKLAEFVLKKEDAPKNSCASLNFVCPETIRLLNKNYRNIDTATDVLSFECDGIDDNFCKQENFEFGDVFICIDVAIKNAKKYNTSLKNELKLLCVHGMLHLCGYDHIKEEQAQMMEAREDELLNLWEQDICQK